MEKKGSISQKYIHRTFKGTLVQVQATESDDDSVYLIKSWRYCEFATLFFVLCSMIASIIDYEMNYSSNRSFRDCSNEYNKNSILKYVTLFSSVLALIFLLIGTHAQIQWEDYLFITDPLFNGFSRQRSYKVVIFEIILILLFPYPSLDTQFDDEYGTKEEFIAICYNLSEILYSVMWLRLYFLLKVVISNTEFVGHVARRVTLENKVKPGLLFYFKCMFKKNPMAMIIFFIGLPTIVAIGMMTRVYERPLISLSNQDWVNPVIAIWFSYSTMMLGVYGDYYPLSTAGKLANVVAYIIGTLFFVLIFVNMQNQAFLTRKQRKAFIDISLMPYAANSIKKAIRYYGILRTERRGRIQAFKEFQTALFQFKHKRRSLFNTIRQRELDIVELMRSIKKTEKQMDKIYKKVDMAVQLVNKRSQIIG